MFGWLRRRRIDPTEGDVVTLVGMSPGQVGVIVDVRGGRRMEERLAALGVRKDKRIKKVSSMLLRGPVTIEVDRSQVAIGFHTAARILVGVSVK